MKKQEIYNIVKNHLLKYGADEIADIIDIDEENLLRVVHKIAKNISNEISERESTTDQSKQPETKALHIADVGSSVLLPKGFKIYKCTDCKEINVKKDNREITVGYCDNCGHPLWNDDVD